MTTHLKNMETLISLKCVYLFSLIITSTQGDLTKQMMSLYTCGYKKTALPRHEMISDTFYQSFLTVENSALCFKNYLDDNDEKLYWQQWGLSIDVHDPTLVGSTWTTGYGRGVNNISKFTRNLFKETIDIPTSNGLVTEMYDMVRMEHAGVYAYGYRKLITNVIYLNILGDAKCKQNIYASEDGVYLIKCSLAVSSLYINPLKFNVQWDLFTYGMRPDHVHYSKFRNYVHYMVRKNLDFRIISNSHKEHLLKSGLKYYVLYFQCALSVKESLSMKNNSKLIISYNKKDTEDEILHIKLKVAKDRKTLKNGSSSEYAGDRDYVTSTLTRYDALVAFTISTTLMVQVVAASILKASQEAHSNSEETEIFYIADVAGAVSSAGLTIMGRMMYTNTGNEIDEDIHGEAEEDEQAAIYSPMIFF